MIFRNDCLDVVKWKHVHFTNAGAKTEGDEDDNGLHNEFADCIDSMDHMEVPW